MTVTPSPRVAVVLVAAGSGTRLAAGAPKAFVGIDTQPILQHAVAGAAEASFAQLIIVAPEGREGEARTIAASAAPDRGSVTSVVTGGATRQESVAAGLRALLPTVEIVLVHDAARALTPPEVFHRVVDAVAQGAPAVVPVLPVVDTVKRVDDGLVLHEVDRSELAAAQTPQGFRRDVLETAYRAASTDFTDDAALVASAGHRVATVEGSPRAFKITTPSDLDRARHLLADAATSLPVPREPSSGAPRVGIGTDVHAFSTEGTLWLAGLEWPGEPALAGHSDGDAVAHAIVDAVLAAAGLGDIGSVFGTSDPEFAGAHADIFLRHVRTVLAEAGMRVGNVSVQVQTNRPRFSGRRAEAESVLSAALGASVSVSATTTDGLGFTGAGEGVQAIAVALILSR